MSTLCAKKLHARRCLTMTWPEPHLSVIGAVHGIAQKEQLGAFHHACAGLYITSFLLRPPEMQWTSGKLDRLL